MDRREFIQRVFDGERSDRLPRALFGGGRWSFRMTGLKMSELRKDPAGFADTLADFFGGLDTDMLFPGSGLNTLPAEAIGGVLDFREEQAPLLRHPLIQKTEDARFFVTIDLADAPHALSLVELIRQLRRKLPDRFFCATSWGPFTWGMILCDWNLLQRKAAEDREFVREVCELGVRLSQAFLEPLVKDGLIDAVSIPDGAVTLIPPDLYRDVVLPSERRLFAWARQRGVRGVLHQCGNIRSQFGLYPEAGPDCISLDAGVPIGEAYQTYCQKVVTAGNVDVVNVVFGGDAELIRTSVMDCVRSVPDPFTKYILMPSCDLPPDTPLKNARTFLACADRF